VARIRPAPRLDGNFRGVPTLSRSRQCRGRATAGSSRVEGTATDPPCLAGSLPRGRENAHSWPPRPGPLIKPSPTPKNPTTAHPRGQIELVRSQRAPAQTGPSFVKPLAGRKSASPLPVRSLAREWEPTAAETPRSLRYARPSAHLRRLILHSCAKCVRIQLNRTRPSGRFCGSPAHR
jgi:hypothetical protein